MNKHLFVDLRIFKRAGLHSGDHSCQLVKSAHIFELRHLFKIIVESEYLLAYPFFKLCRLLLVELRLRLVDKSEHVAHAEDSASHTVGVEGLDLIQLFAHTDILDGFTRNVADGKRRAASGVTVQLGEDDACDVQHIVKGFGNVYRLLTDHRVDGEQYLGRLGCLLDVLKLLHKKLVYLKATRGIYKHGVIALFVCKFNTFGCDFDGRFLIS